MPSLSFSEPLPEPFLRRVADQLPTPNDLSAFVATLAAAEPPLSVRLNRRKQSPAFAADATEPVPWCTTGRYLSGPRPTFALDPLWHAGAYYVQEPASMLVEWALRLHLPDSPRIRRALDLCAAPGGKATLLADLLPDDALLVANEVIRPRARILSENLTRWGWPNVAITNHDPSDFAPLGGFFDVVLLDAPCSGEGLFRKEPEAVREWSEANAALCAARQRRILNAALPLVAPGGLLIYSTCTYNPAENEESVAWILAQGGDWKCLPLTAPPEWGVTPTAHGIQCWPHRCRGEGFYLSVLRRGGDAVPRSSRERRLQAVPRPQTLAPREADAARAFLAAPYDLTLLADKDGAPVAVPQMIAEDMTQVAAALPRTQIGLPLGVFKGKDLIPSHELALSAAVSPEVPGVALNRTQALRYLRKEVPEVPDDATPGWTLMRYEGLALGWAKVLPGRVNNYLPTEWRLRKSGE